MVGRRDAIPLIILAACLATGACRSPRPEASATAAPLRPLPIEAVATPRGVFSPGELWFRLVAIGREADPREAYMNLQGTNSCCHDIRSGWLTYRGGYWVAVDTMAEVDTSGNAHTVSRSGPFFLRVDSGFLAQSRDTAYFESQVFKSPIRTAGAVGVVRGDTLTIRTARAPYADFSRIDLVRVYVRVRSPKGRSM